VTDHDPVASAGDWNRAVIEEFRANAGAVGGQFAGMSLLLLHTNGAKSGLERINPVAYQRVGDDYAVFASKAGAPSDPDWFRNLSAHPEVTVEVAGETFPATARVTEGEERERIWEQQKRDFPGFAEYEEKTARRIPVVVLSRA